MLQHDPKCLLQTMPSNQDRDLQEPQTNKNTHTHRNAQVFRHLVLQHAFHDQLGLCRKIAPFRNGQVVETIHLVWDQWGKSPGDNVNKGNPPGVWVAWESQTSIVTTLYKSLLLKRSNSPWRQCQTMIILRISSMAHRIWEISAYFYFGKTSEVNHQYTKR